MLNVVHDGLANAVLLYFILMFVWSIWRYFRKEGVNSSYRGALVTSSVLILVQGAVGLLLWLGEHRPDRGGIHVLYGVIGGIGIPFLFSILRNEENRTEVLLYGLLYLFLIGIVIRAMTTG